MIRKPCVAGQFYASNPEALKKEIDISFNIKPGPEKHFKNTSSGAEYNFKGGIAPHAGYVYSGYEAAHLYMAMYESGLPETVIIIGPCHRASSNCAIGVFPGTGFETPLGICRVDTELSSLIAAAAPFSFDEKVHRFEHSIEVQIPFLQYIYETAHNPLKIAALCVADQRYSTATAAVKVLTAILKERVNNFAIIASSDFSHYLPEHEAHKYDNYAINEILKLDMKAMYKTIDRYDISMCGFAPISICADTLRELYPIKASLLKYGSSGDIRPAAEVVGYAAISFETVENKI